mmetsp:Transcript_27006/g.67875  ORF Transcript_27006/g.67875 Transcript_27006/m.67875 type:complete len:278 (-) Transcript_27006:536-1369(-)
MGSRLSSAQLAILYGHGTSSSTVATPNILASLYLPFKATWRSTTTHHTTSSGPSSCTASCWCKHFRTRRTGRSWELITGATFVRLSLATHAKLPKQEGKQSEKQQRGQDDQKNRPPGKSTITIVGIVIEASVQPDAVKLDIHGHIVIIVGTREQALNHCWSWILTEFTFHHNLTIVDGKLAEEVGKTEPTANDGNVVNITCTAITSDFDYGKAGKLDDFLHQALKTLKVLHSERIEFRRLSHNIVQCIHVYLIANSNAKHTHACRSKLSNDGIGIVG